MNNTTSNTTSKKVAAELVAGEAGHTLFDFVDDASLASLKLQAQVRFYLYVFLDACERSVCLCVFGGVSSVW